MARVPIAVALALLLAGCGTMEKGQPNLRATVTPGGVPDRGQTGSPNGTEGALGGENSVAYDPLTPGASSAGGQSAAVFPPTAPPEEP